MPDIFTRPVIYIIIGIVLAVAVIVGFSALFIALWREAIRARERAIEAAGQQGEVYVTDMILAVLRSEDMLFTNVSIEYEGRRTELDNIVVNESGVFIVEAKNYHGILEGRPEDREWKKYNVTPAGNTYMKTVRNPIKQVGRQIHILKSFIKQETGITVWIEGYVVFAEANCPFDDEHVLVDYDDIDNAIHPDISRLRNNRVRKIGELFENSRFHPEYVWQTGSQYGLNL